MNKTNLDTFQGCISVAEFHNSEGEFGLFYVRSSHLMATQLVCQSGAPPHALSLKSLDNLEQEELESVGGAEMLIGRFRSRRYRERRPLECISAFVNTCTTTELLELFSM